MIELIKTPLFGVMLSVIAFEIGIIIYNKTKISLLNPLLIGQIIITVILVLFKIDYNDYNTGGRIISFFIIPATVVLAVPLYKKIELLKLYAIPILGGIFVGSLSGLVSIILLSKLFNLNDTLLLSLLPKSITSPFGMEVSKQIGGIPSLTIAIIIFTGILGSIIGPYVFKLFKINNKVAVGISFGTSSHSVGTSKALEIGEEEGAMSGLAIGVAGVITVLLTPLVIKLFQYLTIL